MQNDFALTLEGLKSMKTEVKSFFLLYRIKAYNLKIRALNGIFNT